VIKMKRHYYQRIIFGLSIFTACCLSASNISSEEELTRGLSCFEIGYRFGRCATQAMLGKKCDPKDDVIVPERCQDQAETKRGIEAGVNSVYKP